jgi:hypothetical protein
MLDDEFIEVLQSDQIHRIGKRKDFYEPLLRSLRTPQIERFSVKDLLGSPRGATNMPVEHPAAMNLQPSLATW